MTRAHRILVESTVLKLTRAQRIVAEKELKKHYEVDINHDGDLEVATDDAHTIAQIMSNVGIHGYVKEESIMSRAKSILDSFLDSDKD